MGKHLKSVKASWHDGIDESVGGHRKDLAASPSSQLYYAIRMYLHKKRWLLRCSQIVRGLWILGPLRANAVRYYQRHSHNPPLQISDLDIFPNLEVQKVVDELNTKGYSSGVQL